MVVLDFLSILEAYDLANLFWYLMEAVRHGSQLQLDSTGNRPIDMISESNETAIIVFVLETASRGYLAHINRSPNEGVMKVLQNSRKTGVEF